MLEQLNDESRLYPTLQRVLADPAVLVAVPDATLFNNRTISNILLTAYHQRSPVVGFSPACVKAGALRPLQHSGPDRPAGRREPPAPGSPAAACPARGTAPLPVGTNHYGGPAPGHQPRRRSRAAGTPGTRSEPAMTRLLRLDIHARIALIAVLPSLVLASC